MLHNSGNTTINIGTMSVQDMSQLLVAGTVYVHPRPEVGISGHLPEQFVAEYRARVNNQSVLGELQSAQSYDAVWTIALALNTTINALSHSGT